MANTVITYPAQKLTIKSMRGHHFKLVINVKDSDGSNYDFDPGTQAGTPTGKMYVRTTAGAPVMVAGIVYAGPGQVEIPIEDELEDALNITIEDGKITIEWTYPFAYQPAKGRYKYNLVTIDPTSTDDPQRIWLYGDFIVEDSIPALQGA